MFGMEVSFFISVDLRKTDLPLLRGGRFLNRYLGLNPRLSPVALRGRNRMRSELLKLALLGLKPGLIVSCDTRWKGVRFSSRAQLRGNGGRIRQSRILDRESQLSGLFKLWRNSRNAGWLQQPFLYRFSLLTGVIHQILVKSAKLRSSFSRW
jgi:hypothetical protein